MKKIKLLKHTALSLTLAFTMVACSETPEQKMDRENITNLTVDISAEVCNTGPKNYSEKAYKTRLRNILDDTNLKTLKTLYTKNLTICLDQRLSKQKNGTFDKRIDGILYPNEAVISLWDDGTMPNNKTFFSFSAYKHGDVTLEKLAKSINSYGGFFSATKINPKIDFALAARYSQGKNGSVTKWKKEKDFDQDTIKNNPQLKQSPLKTKQKTYQSRRNS